jgi:ribose-phosphate pyrophosphokinase
MDMQHEKILLPERVVVQFNAPELGAGLAQAFGATLLVADVVRFADTECDVVLEQPFHAMTGKTVVLVAQFGGRLAAWSINDFLLSLCFLVSRIRAAGIVSLVCVLPYFPYARQDLSPVHGGVSSALILSNLLKSAGVDELVVFDLHSVRLLEQTPLSITNITCKDFWIGILRTFMQQLGSNEYVLVAPDNGAAMRVQAVAEQLGIQTCFVAKRRTDINQASAISLNGSVLGKYALILDDIIDTGRTAVGAAELVLNHGALGVSGFFTHAVLSSASLAVMQVAQFDRVVVADTLHRTALSYGSMSYVSITSFIVENIAKIMTINPHQGEMQQGLYERSI